MEGFQPAKRSSIRRVWVSPLRNGSDRITSKRNSTGVLTPKTTYSLRARTILSDRPRPVPGVDDQFAQDRVIGRGDCKTAVNPRVDPDPRPGRLLEVEDLPGEGMKPLSGSSA